MVISTITRRVVIREPYLSRVLNTSSIKPYIYKLMSYKGQAQTTDFTLCTLMYNRRFK